MNAYELDFDWRGFELHPEIPLGGMDLTQMFPAQAVKGMRARLEQAAKGFDVPLRFPSRSNNTRAALAMAEYARDQGKLDGFRDAGMAAFWRDGGDLEDRALLRQLAEGAGLNADAALAAIDDPEMVQRVAAMGQEAARWGVTGIPTWFVLPEGWTPEQGIPQEGPRPVRVVGCQPYEVVERAAKMAGAKAR